MSLVGFNDFIVGSISFSEMLTDFILVFLLYEMDCKVFGFFIGVHIDAKMFLKCLLSHRNQKQISHD